MENDAEAKWDCVVRQILGLVLRQSLLGENDAEAKTRTGGKWVFNGCASSEEWG